MPLQTPTTLAAARITECAVNSRSHYQAAVGQMNAITAAILALPNDDLAAFGNALGPQEMDALSTSHAEQGTALNALLAAVNAVLAASGIEPATATVDVRPLSEKLAAQRREIVLADGVFSVVDFPAEVAPELEPEATVEPTS